MVPRSATLLSAFLAATAVYAAPAPLEKRADWVTATINGQVVSWENNWNPQSTPAAQPSQQTGAAQNNNGGQWITAVYNGNTFSWQANAPTAAPVASAPASSPAQTTAAAPAPSATNKNTDPSCRDTHIFLARGNNEPYPGRMGKLAGAICYGLDSCDYEDIMFYNPVDSDYCTAVKEGDVNGISQITGYAQKCPGSKLVLSGYSQGSNVVGDVLGGSDFCGGPNPGLDPSTSPGNQLGAILIFGDTRHVANQPYNVLSGADAGSNSPRTGDSLERMNKFSGIMRSYCDHSDPVCAAAGPGPFDVNNHLNYFDLYSDDAAGWVKYTLGY